jgi:hypothetical protein
MPNSTQHLSLYSTSPANFGTDRSSAVKQRELLLSKLETVLTNLIIGTGSGMGAEARLWLTSDISLLSVAEDLKFARYQEVLFKKMKVEDSSNTKFIEQALLLCCQRLPTQVAKIFKHKGSIFRRFFEEDKSRIRNWFNHFKFSGDHQYGAVGLEKYLFDFRDEYWSKLRWIGRRDVPPCVAVHKRNLFLELDVLAVVEMLADEDDKFWYSTQFQDDLESGDFLAIDYMFFVHEMMDFLRDERDAPEVLDVLVAYIKFEPHKELCLQLLRFFSDNELLAFLYHIVPYNKHMSLAEYVLSECRWVDLEELIMFNAIANHSNTVMSHFFRDDEAADVREDFESWLSTKMRLNSQEDKVTDQTSHWAYRYYIQDDQGGGGAAALVKAKFLLLEGFLLLYRLKASEATATRENLEILFKNEGLAYTPVIVQEEIPQEDEMHTKKKHKHRHKRRRSHSPSPPPPTFVGWQFQSATHDKSPTVTYGIKETPQYLYTTFVENTFRCLLSSKK